MIRYFRKLLNHMHDSNDILDSLIHTMVVGQSANTYRNTKYILDNSLLVDTNSPSNKRRYVGGDTNPLYPDIIVWKPNFPGSSAGTTVVVEEIETEKTLYTKANFWKKLGNISGILFFLVVPAGKENDALNIIKQHGIRVDQIQTYSYNPTSKLYTFKNSGLV